MGSRTRSTGRGRGPRSPSSSSRPSPARGRRGRPRVGTSTRPRWSRTPWTTGSTGDRRRSCGSEALTWTPSWGTHPASTRTDDRVEPPPPDVNRDSVTSAATETERTSRSWFRSTPVGAGSSAERWTYAGTAGRRGRLARHRSCGLRRGCTTSATCRWSWRTSSRRPLLHPRCGREGPGTPYAQSSLGPCPRTVGHRGPLQGPQQGSNPDPTPTPRPRPPGTDVVVNERNTKVTGLRRRRTWSSWTRRHSAADRPGPSDDPQGTQTGTAGTRRSRTGTSCLGSYTA